MRPGGARNKGSSFERKLAGDIVESARVHKRECYRTPLSGGHVFACPSDLQMSERLRKLFPFSVEAKDQKIFKISQMFNPTKGIQAWLQQCIDAADSARQVGSKVTPLVVMHEHRGLTYAAGYSENINKFMWPISAPVRAPRLLFRYKKKSWTVIPWNLLMERLSVKSKF